MDPHISFKSICKAFDIEEYKVDYQEWEMSICSNTKFGLNLDM